MAETLASRVGRIVSGSLNALVGAVEDSAPEMLMQQAIREVDLAVDDVRTELGKLLAKKHLATTRLLEENRRHEELAGQLEVAIAEGRDDLAEAAIARQLDIEAQIPVIERTVAECAEQETEFEGFIAALLARRREMEGELEIFAQSRKTQPDTTAPATPGNRAEQAKDAFDRVLARNAGVAGSKATIDTEKKLAELDELARANRVKERLAAAKAQLGND
ncbi:MAG: PspA/IM30 family protein [Myxococcota bacterium]